MVGQKKCGRTRVVGKKLSDGIIPLINGIIRLIDHSFLFKLIDCMVRLYGSWLVAQGSWLMAHGQGGLPRPRGLGGRAD